MSTIEFLGQPDTDSEHDVYGQRLGPSAESLNGGRTSAPNLGDFGASQYNTGREPYPAWGAERVIPLSKEEIEDIFLDLQQKFGFPRDSMRNMVRSCNVCYAIWRLLIMTNVVRLHDSDAPA